MSLHSSPQAMDLARVHSGRSALMKKINPVTVIPVPEHAAFYVSAPSSRWRRSHPGPSPFIMHKLARDMRKFCCRGLVVNVITSRLGLNSVTCFGVGTLHLPALVRLGFSVDLSNSISVDFLHACESWHIRPDIMGRLWLVGIMVKLLAAASFSFSNTSAKYSSAVEDLPLLSVTSWM